jgi:hypothetical protein
MPYTVRVRATLARHLLEEPNEDLRRRLAALRATPYPPGSRSIASDAEFAVLAERFPGVHAFIYGTATEGLVYTFHSSERLLIVEFAILDGKMVP